MSVLHLTHATRWRGGENQLFTLVRNLPDEWRGELVAPPGSEIAARLAAHMPVVEAANAGFADIRSILKVRQLLRSGRFRLIHAHTSRAHEVAMMARIGLSMPMLVSRRNAFVASGGLKYRGPERFVAISRASADRIADAGVERSRISIIHCAVELPARPDVRPDPLSVVCVAAFEAEKDHATLLAAWRAVEREEPAARLRLVGEGSLQERIVALAGELGLKRVSIEPTGDLLEQYRDAGIAVLTSVEEGLGSSLCLAQGMGVPVVATRAGGIPEVVEEGVTGLLAEPGDAEGLAAALLRLMRDDGLRAALSKAGPPRARRLFDAADAARRYAAIYADMAGEAQERASRLSA